MANAAQLKISQLTALVAVADHGSFSTAALHLNLAQSTISHAIATLETELGIVLIIRGRSGAVLTPLGLQICRQARTVLTQLDGIRHTAQQAKGLQAGRVRVAAFRTVATHILPDVISRFRRSHPALTVEIDEYDRYAEVEQALKEGRADLGFVLLPASTDFQCWEILHDDFVALLPPAPETTARADSPLTWEELVSYPRAANKRSTQNNRLVEEHLAQFGYHLPIDYAVREDSTLMSLVTKGLGAAVLARLEAEPIPPSVRVKSLPEPLERIIGVAILENAVLPRAVFVFLDVLLAVPLQETGRTTSS